ncbi:MAG: tetratricopeptide repeat protein [Candidatus Obscuribacterales bacterium]|nr:tetratricopeptide repeat protein [Candidatus Obscuribacterales bacterium]
MKTAAELQTLANVAEERGDYAKAARLHQKALTKMEKQVGLDQPELLEYLFNLGMIKYALDQKEAAETAFTRQLDILLQYYPEEHMDVIELRQIITEIHANEEEVAVHPLKITA